MEKYLQLWYPNNELIPTVTLSNLDYKTGTHSPSMYCALRTTDL